MSYPLPDPLVSFEQQPELMVLTQCIFGEVANQSDTCKIGVGWTALNRLLEYRSEKEYGPRTWHGVLLHPGAYDCFNKLKSKLLHPLDHETIDTWDECYSAAVGVMTHVVIDPTDQATHYYDESIKPPYWAKSPLMQPAVTIGVIHFYRYKK